MEPRDSNITTRNLKVESVWWSGHLNLLHTTALTTTEDHIRKPFKVESFIRFFLVFLKKQMHGFF